MMPITLTIPESYIQPFPLQERDSLRRLISVIEDAINTELGTFSLNDLSDVIAPSPVIGDSIFFDGTDWVNDSPTTQVVSSSTTPYIAALTDNAKYIVLTSGSPMTFEIPPQGTVGWADGSQFEIQQGGAGQITIQGGSGVTVNKASSFADTTRTQYSVVGVKRVSENVWTLFGDLDQQ